MAVLVAPPSASAQTETDDPAESDTQPPADEESAPNLPQAFEGEVAISLEKFGAGNVARAGDWAGFLIKVHDSGTKPRDVLIRLANTDADGDLATQQRLVATNPGRDQSFWLYSRLAFEDFRHTPMEVTVYEAVPSGTDNAAPEFTHRAGRLLGRTVIEPRLGDSGQLRGPTEGLIGLIGTGNRPLGLSDYSVRNPNEAFSSRGQEVTSIVHLTLDDLPDRWMGLAAMDTLVWGSGDVSQLRQEKARAIREWVERGGHLIVILPTVGQTWTTSSANELFSLLPAVKVDREETANYAAYRPMLTGDVKTPNYPEKGVMHTFSLVPQASPADATPILCGNDGACVVVRRLVGMGAVTMIGLDLNNEKLQKFIDADIFWHRVMGRRGNFTPVKAQQGGYMGNPFKAWNVDKDIADIISVKGASALGALLGFTVFALYWLVVGPPGYFLLKKQGLHKHAWVGFVAGSAFFTVLAWGGARALRPFKTSANHLTIIDHVYGQPIERARVWANVLVPRYGEARISVGDKSGTVDQSLCSIAPWENPEDTSGSTGSFPDSRNYPIDTLSPDAMNVPVRSTVKTIQADWAGPPVLGMPRPVNDTGGTGEIRVTPNWSANSNKPLITGTLVHDLPFALRNVHVIVVREQTRIAGNPVATPNFVADVYTMTGTWEPGEQGAKDLEVLRNTTNGNTSLSLYMDQSLIPVVQGQYGLADVVDRLSNEQRLVALTLFHHLRPPDAPDGTGTQPMAAVPQRRAMHGLDLSRWFTQPCVIVIGFTQGEGKEGKCPVPLFVSDAGGDPQELATKGMTMVRWVYPLPARPPDVIEADKQGGRVSRDDSRKKPPENPPEEKPDLLPGEEGGN